MMMYRILPDSQQATRKRMKGGMGGHARQAIQFPTCRLPFNSSDNHWPCRLSEQLFHHHLSPSAWSQSTHPGHLGFETAYVERDARPPKID
jgi:hypothetical protein